MKIIEVARENKNLFNEGIAFIAVWREAQRNGRLSWYSEAFTPTEVEDGTPYFNEEDLAKLTEVSEKDSEAVLLNGYYDSWLGSAEEPLNAAAISEGIKKHYEMGNAKLSAYLESETDDKVPAYEDLQMTEHEDGMQESDVLDFEESENSGHEADSEKETEGLHTSEETAETAHTVETEDTITIELPWKSCGDLTNAKETLTQLIGGKATLIKAALGEDVASHNSNTDLLPIEFTSEKTVKFKWLRLGTESETIKAWAAFLSAAVAYSKKEKRVTAKDSPLGDNPKFSFRTFLVKIGMNSPENKAFRKILLQKLHGDAAFATPESKVRWQEKYQKGGDFADRSAKCSARPNESCELEGRKQ